MKLVLRFNRELLVQRVAGQLRELHAAWSHPEAGEGAVCLVLKGWARQEALGVNGVVTELVTSSSVDVHAVQHEYPSDRMFGFESVPGDGAKFNARAAAIRLVSDLVSGTTTAELERARVPDKNACYCSDFMSSGMPCPPGKCPNVPKG